MITIIKEYGFLWLFYRVVYALKLHIMNLFPITERLYEKKIEIKNVDIFHIDVKAIELFLTELPNLVQKNIIKEANLVVEGKIKAFSSITLDYGNPINWHYNPITKKESDKNIKWYRIKDFDAERGDIKVIWEPSRFSHFYILLRAYMITKDIKYYNSYSQQINNWLDNNPYSYGANYKDGQEASIRMINALIAYTVFNNYELITKEDKNNTFKIVEGSYKKIMANFSYAYKSIKNNHTLSELNGMIIGSLCSNDDKQEKKAFNLLNEIIDEQFTDDGGYIQKSFNYQRFALQMLEVSLKLEQKSQYTISKSNKNKIRASNNLLHQAHQTNGMVPNYGHNDGALIFPLSSCDFTDYRSVLNSINILLNGERLYEPGMYDEESIWFNGKELPDKVKPNQRVSSSFYKAGLFINRLEDTFVFTILNDYKTRPAHMDQLHFELWHKDIEILSDQGTYSYSSDTGKANILNSSHNTVEIKGTQQMDLKGPFFIYNWTNRGEVKFNSDYFFGGYSSQNGYSHKRELKLEKSLLNITDYIEGKKDTIKRIHFHTPLDVIAEDKKILLSYKEEIIAEINTKFEFYITKASKSNYYLKEVPINKITIETKKNKIHTTIKLI